jgi:hypothetical protein
MRTGLQALDEIDWSRLHHAYGRAGDTPAHLRALLDGDEAQRQAAVRHLWSAIVHQGTPWTATGPVARVLAGFLDDVRIDRPPHPVRAAILDFLGAVAETPERNADVLARSDLERLAAFDLDAFTRAHGDEAIYEDEEASAAFFIQSLRGCRDALPLFVGPVLAGLGRGDRDVRVRAAVAAVALARAGADVDRGELARRLSALASAAGDADERSTLVLAVGDLGADTRAYLGDAAPGVRLCAALAPALADHDAARAELLRSLEQNAGAIDDWFAEKPPQFPSRPRFTVVARTLERFSDFDRLADAAVAVARATSKDCVDGDWGPLLAAAFARGDGRLATAAQRRYLGALVERLELWDPRFGNPGRWFRAAGLPYDWVACAELLEATATTA